MATHSRFLSGKSGRQRNLVDGRSLGCKESAMTEVSEDARTHCL